MKNKTTVSLTKIFWAITSPFRGRGGFLLLLVLLLPILAHADTSLTDPGGDVDAPIDGGLSLLVAAGVGYGAKKLKEKRKK